MNIVGIIPARGGSKRTPRKNIKLLAGKPLIAYSIEAALKSKYINKVVVSTEDAEIAEVARSFGAEVIARPPELAQDTTKTAPVLVQVVNELEKQGYFPDIVCLLQATSPQRDEKVVDGALEMLINSEKDSVFAGSKIGKTMAKWKRGYDGKLHPLYDHHFRPRTQEPELMEDMFQENGSFYAIKIEAFRKYQDFLGEDVEFFETPVYIDIDSPVDFARAEQEILKGRENEQKARQEA